MLSSPQCAFITDSPVEHDSFVIGRKGKCRRRAARIRPLDLHQTGATAVTSSSFRRVRRRLLAPTLLLVPLALSAQTVKPVQEADWRKANDAVGALQRGHADVLR